jgi:alcohol dehydrogenase
MQIIFKKDRKELKKKLNSKNFEKIFLITGRNSFYKSGADKIIKNLCNNKKILFFFKKNSYPDIKELKKIINILNREKPDLILAIGGGCVLDYAKLANVFYNEKNIILKVKKSIYNFKEKAAPLIAIPTTAGSGAEVTPFAVLYINKEKFSVENLLVKPDYHFILPELILNNPKKLKSSAGFDAIAQALESLVSVKSNSQSIDYSAKSLNLSIKNYPKFINSPNLENSFKMSLAANLAGKAIATAKTNGPHATSYPFSAHFGIEHGHAVSLTINQFMVLYYLNHQKSVTKFNLKNRFNKIFKILKIQNIYEFDLLLKNIKKLGNLEGNYNKLGIDISKQYSKIIGGVNLQRLNNCPIKIVRKDIKSILLMDL